MANLTLALTLTDKQGALQIAAAFEKKYAPELGLGLKLGLKLGLGLTQ